MQAVEGRRNQQAARQAPPALPLDRLLQQWQAAGPRQLPLTALAAPPPRPPVPLAELLAGQLNWTDAVLLSQALALPTADAAAASDRPGAPAASAPADAVAHAAAWARAALERLRAELQAGFDDPLLADDARRAQVADGPPLADALAPWRLHHAQQQRAMAARVASLRERLRVRLAGCGAPRLPALAALDAVLERALAGREAQALAALSARLFGERAAQHHAADAQHWPAALWQDLQQALQAELDFRLQPLLGLQEALDDPR